MASEDGNRDSPDATAAGGAAVAEVAAAATVAGEPTVPAASSVRSPGASQSVALDPYRCLAKKLAKYAGECEEVYLANLGGTSLAETFRHFTSLEVAWLNGNRLSRLENLDCNVRLRELYIQNNRLVSLNGLQTFKFLRVLLASGNQLQRLDKQLALLSRFGLLKKLDLLDNPVSEEPDYRLRVIYAVPQVELLDRKRITEPQRQKAQEVVPNLDKVLAPRAVEKTRKSFHLSLVEKKLFREADFVRTRRQKLEDAHLRTQALSRSVDALARAPLPSHLRDNQDRWSKPTHQSKHALVHPTPWERDELRQHIEQLAAEKEELSRQDVEGLVNHLATHGVESVGRVLSRTNIFGPLPATPQATFAREDGGTQPREKAHPLGALLGSSEEATVPVETVIDHLLTLQWHHPDDDALDKKIAELYRDAHRATFSGDDEAVATHRNAALRLEGIKTRKYEVSLATTKVGPLGKSRSDVFSQTVLRPSRGSDELPGRTMLRVASTGRTIAIKT